MDAIGKITLGMEKKERNVYLDTLRGIFVLYMIFGHCCQFAQISDREFYNYLSIILIVICHGFSLNREFFFEIYYS